ncbi:MAG: hypothetical protein VZS44_11510 [Bacilli bacterium]|nr:hypothetical protein [Bacilli bacterium]
MFTKNDYMKENYKIMFRKIYSEQEIKIRNINLFDNCSILEADFPDGTFYFVVTNNSVSSSFNTYSDAKRSIL